MFILFSTIISMVIGIVSGIIDVPIIGSIYSLAVLVPSIAVAIRIMHDVGKSGWYCLIPIYNLILACTEGEPNTNEYGLDPKNFNHDEVYEIGTETEE